MTNTALVPVHRPNDTATSATLGTDLAPCSTPIAAAHTDPRATALNARPSGTVAERAPLRQPGTLAIEPRIAAAAIQRYRKSMPVVTARMPPKATGTAAANSAIRSDQ